MYCHFGGNDIRFEFWAHVTFLLFTTIIAPSVQHSVVPGLISGEVTAGVGEVAAGVGEVAAGVGFACVAIEFETFSVKKVAPPIAHKMSYFKLPTVFGALKVNEIRPLLFKLNLVWTNFGRPMVH